MVFFKDQKINELKLSKHLGILGAVINSIVCYYKELSDFGETNIKSRILEDVPKLFQCLMILLLAR